MEERIRKLRMNKALRAHFTWLESLTPEEKAERLARTPTDFGTPAPVSDDERWAVLYAHVAAMDGAKEAGPDDEWLAEYYVRANFSRTPRQSIAKTTNRIALDDAISLVGGGGLVIFILFVVCGL